MHPKLSLVGMLLSLAVFLGSGCRVHEQDGDRALALGDYRQAASEYQLALENQEPTPVLRAKFDSARRQAVAAATATAKACLLEEKWQCALDNGLYVAALDPANVDASATVNVARRNLARNAAIAAVDAAQAGDFSIAYQHLEEAWAMSKDREVAPHFAAAVAKVGAAAVAEARRLCAGHDYAAAVALVTKLVKYDPTRREELSIITNEQGKWSREQYDLSMACGDAAYKDHRWSAAADCFQAAVAARSTEKATALLAYAQAMVRAESAIAAEDFSGATAELKTAVGTHQDAGGFVTVLLNKVEIRKYLVRVSQVLVAGHDPAGNPWVGPKSNAFIAIIGNLMAPGAGTAAKAVLDSIPAENIPELRVEATLPDGRKLQTPAKKALYATYGSTFVVSANHYSSSTLTLRVVAKGDRRQDVGVVTIRLGDLVAQGHFSAKDSQSIRELELNVEPAHGVESCSYFGDMEPVVADDPENLAKAWSVPGRKAIGAFRLTGIEVTVAQADHNMAWDGPPDLSVEISQNGRVVFIGAERTDQWRASWRPSNVIFYPEFGERWEVAIIDRNAVNPPTRIGGWTANGASIVSGSFSTGTKLGSQIRIVAEPLKCE